MAEHNRKRSENLIELDPEETTYVLEPAKVEVGSGYAICVHYDENDRPIIDVKTYGKVDHAKLQKEINRIFPNGKIRQLDQTNEPVTVVKKEKKKRKK
jgi:hypothetical protein